MVELVDRLKARIIGQDEAVMQVSRVIKLARAGLKLSDHRPMGVFLFLGPSGVGKGELARALAEMVFGEYAICKLDTSVYGEDSINWLLGLNREEDDDLARRVRHSIVVVFQDIEKATPDVIAILWRTIEEGLLMDSRGNRVDFRNAVIIATSNLGAKHLAVPVLTDENKAATMEEVRAHFHPELLKHFDEIVMFHALSEENLAEIWHLLLKQESQMLSEQRGIILTISEAATQWLLDQNHEPEYGGFPLRRIIRRLLREPLAEFLIERDSPAGTEIKINTAAKKDGGLTFSAVINGQDVTVEG